MKRTHISKKIRFEIFARDGFTCRYCGRQSDKVKLEVDHLIPVCKGGTNIETNLITACEDCNAGKSGNLISQSAPTETDRLRLAQEFNEQNEINKKATESIKTERRIRAKIINRYCETFRQDGIRKECVSHYYKMCMEFGPELLFQWFNIASDRAIRGDTNICKYIHGIRKNYQKAQS